MSFSSRVKEELSQADESGQALPDCGDCGDFEPVRAGFTFRRRISYSITDPYGKCGGCKKILYIIEKNI